MNRREVLQTIGAVGLIASGSTAIGSTAMGVGIIPPNMLSRPSELFLYSRFFSLQVNGVIIAWNDLVSFAFCSPLPKQHTVIYTNKDRNDELNDRLLIFQDDRDMLHLHFNGKFVDMLRQKDMLGTLFQVCDKQNVCWVNLMPLMLKSIHYTATSCSITLQRFPSTHAINVPEA